MNSKQRAKWEKARANGVWYFAARYTLLFSVTMIIATSIFDHFTSYGGFRFEDLYIKVPIYLVGGFITGLAIWFVAEHQYQKKQI